MLTSGIDALVNSLVPRLQTSESQSTAMKIAPDGDTLIVYQGRDLVDDAGIFLRRLSTNLDRSIDFRTNQTVTGEQVNPAIAIYPDGNYVVAWSGRGPGDQRGIFARWYNSQDVPLTDEVLVNQIPGGPQENPDVAITHDGVTVFVWSGSAGSEEPSGVFRRFFNAGGLPLSDQHRVNVTTLGTQDYPAITINDQGRGIVTWSSHDLAENQWRVFQQTFYVSAITPAAPFTWEIGNEEHPVSSQPASNHQRSRVATDAVGNYVVTWAAFDPESTQWNIYARAFDPQGNPQSHDVLVNQYRSSVNRDPHIAMADDGRYIISWTVGNEDGGGWEVYAQSYAPGGLIAETQYLVHSKSGLNSGHQEYSAVAIGHGPAQIAWSGTGLTDRRGVWTQRTRAAESPRLKTIEPQVIDELSPLSIQFSPILGYPEQSVRFDLEPLTHPRGMVIDPNTGRLTWTPSEADGPGEFTAVVEVSDRTDPTLRDRQRIRIQVREVNHSPAISLPPQITLDEGDVLRIFPLGTDPDLPVNTLTYSLVESPSPNVVINHFTGAIHWATTEVDGGFTGPLTIRVTDNGSPSKSATATTTITVNEVESDPVLTPIAPVNIPENQPWQFRVEASDPDTRASENLTYTIDPDLSQKGLTIDSNGVIRWTPTEEDGPGTYAGTVFVTDITGREVSTPLQISVFEVNEPPVLRPLETISTETKQPIQIQALARDPDFPANMIQYSLDEESRQRGIVIDQTTGLIQWTPTLAGIYPVTVTALDNGNPVLTDQRTFSIVVDQPLAPPVFNPIDSQRINEQSPLQFTLTANSQNPGRLLHFAVSGNHPEGLEIDPVSGVVQWTPTEAQGPSLTKVRFDVFDVDTPQLRSSVEVPIEVLEVNAAPQIFDHPESIVDEGQLVEIQFAAIDTDLPKNRLRFAFASDQNVPEGMTLDADTGLLRWQPLESDGPSIWNLEIEVVDDGSPRLRDSTNVRIIVRELNQTPTIVRPPDVAIPEMLPWSLQILVDDPDLPKDSLTLSLDPDSLSRGMVLDTENRLHWSPTETDGPGTYPVTVKVLDDANPPGLAEVTFTIDVYEVNRTPKIEPIPSFSIRAGESVQFQNSATDPDLPKNNLTYSMHGGFPEEATLDPVSGVFNWASTKERIDAQFYSFTVRVSDNGTPALSDDTQVTIEVLPEELVLEEKDRFVTVYEQQIELEAGVTRLEFRFNSLDFDSRDHDSMNDAFEAALVDDAGVPLAGIISAGRDAFLNLSEDQPTLLGSGTIIAWDDEIATVHVDVRHLEPGTSVRLIQRLVNNDHDDHSRVSLVPGITQIKDSQPSFASTTTPPTFAPVPRNRTELSELDWRHLQEITSEVEIAYTQTAFDIDTQTVAAGIEIKNQSNLTLRGPIYLAVTSIDIPEVALVGHQGSVPREASRLAPLFPAEIRGASYYELTDLLENQVLAPGKTLSSLLQFFNPTPSRFTYRLHVLSHINQPPTFIASPTNTVSLGNTYRDAAVAQDPDFDPLTYSLVSGPDGLQLDARTGEITWAPPQEALGSHSVTLEAKDPYGLRAVTTFPIHVSTTDRGNLAPAFVTVPTVDAYVGQSYHYLPLALDPNHDVLVYEMIQGPGGMEIVTEQPTPHGIPVSLRWTPTSAEVDQFFPVTLQATDPLGASALQSYNVRVHGNPQNLPPQIVTLPRKEFTLPQQNLPASHGNVSPNGIQQLLGIDQQITVPVSITLPEETVLSTADIVLVVDESGSMQEQAWIADFIESLEDSLEEKGIRNNRYAITGFGSFLGAPRFVTDQIDYNILVFDEHQNIIDRQTVRAGVPTQPIAFPDDGQYSLAVTRYIPGMGEPPEASIPPLSPLNFQFEAVPTFPVHQERMGWGKHAGLLTDGLVEIPFQSAAGELLLIDGIMGDSINAELIDPENNTIARLDALLDDSQPIILRHTGNYRLVLRGIAGTPYQLALYHPLEDATPITTEVPIEGILSHADSWQFFSIDTLTDANLIVDRLTPNSSNPFGIAEDNQFELHFFGPSGLIKESKIQSSSMLSLTPSSPSQPSDLSGIRSQANHTYSIGVRSTQTAEGPSSPVPFKFEVRDLDAPDSHVILNHPASGSLPSPSGTQIYRFDVSEEIALDFTVTNTNNDNARWQLFDPDGFMMTSGPLINGLRFSQLPVQVAGAYSLVIQGNYDNVAPVDYQWTLSSHTVSTDPPNHPRFLPDELLNASLEANKPTSFFIELNAGDAFFPAFLNNDSPSVWWQFKSPTGGIMHNTFRRLDSFTSDLGTEEATIPDKIKLTAPRTGLYELILFSPHSYAEVIFSLRSAFAPLEYNKWTQGELTSSGSVAIYSFDAEKGESIVLSSVTDTQLLASAEDAIRYASTLRANGNIEDGYWGIDFALEYLSLRPHASQHVILLTDEGRNSLELSLTKDSIASKFNDSNPTLHVIAESRLYAKDTAETGPALGIATNTDFTEAPYRFFYATPEGSPRIVSGREFTTAFAFDNTADNYIDLALSTEGTAWDIQRLRNNAAAGNGEQQSFTRALVSTLTEQIARQNVIGLNFLPSDAPVSIDSPIIDGQTVTFPVHFTGDGDAWDLLFEFIDINSPEIVYGTIPAALSSAYQYDFHAIDPELDPIEYSLANRDFPGSVFDPQQQRLYFSPPAPGVYPFDLTTTDNWGGRDRQTWEVIVSEKSSTNHSPFFETQEVPNVEVGRPIMATFFAHDPDGDAITYRLTTNDLSANNHLPPPGAFIEPTTGYFSWTPNRTQIGYHEITIYASDGRGGSARYVWGVDVVPPRTHQNHPPEFVNRVPTLAIAGSTFRHVVLGKDPDFDPIEFTLAWGPETMLIDKQLGTIVWKPRVEDIGNHPVIVRISDGQGGARLQEVEITVVEANSPPEFLSSPPLIASLNAWWRYTPNVVDPNGDIAEIRLVQPPRIPGVTVSNQTGQISWRPEIPGTHTIEIEAIDHRGGITPQILTIEVRETSPPVLPELTGASFVIGQSNSYEFPTHDFDEGDHHSIQIPTWGTDLGISTDTTSCELNAVSSCVAIHTIHWTPQSLGSYQIPISIIDTGGEQTDVVWNVDIVPPTMPSQPPRFTSVPQGPAFTNTSWSYKPTVFDPDGDSVTVTLESPHDGTLVWDSTSRTLIWPDPQTGSSTTVTLRAIDTSGSSASQTFVVRAIPRPTIQPPQWHSVPSTETTVGSRWEYRAIAVDPSGSPVKITIGTRTDAPDIELDPTTHKVSWTATEVGSRTVEFIAENAFGETASQMFQISVAPRRNRSPDIRSIPTGPAILGQTWTHQVEAFDVDGDQLTYMISTSHHPSEVQIDKSTGRILLIPMSSEPREFTVTVRDDYGAESTQTFRLDVLAPDPPSATPPPVITSAPMGVAYVQTPWIYQLRTGSSNTGPSNTGRVLYSLDEASLSRGATLSTDGILRWVPQETGFHDFEITARGSNGRESVQTFRVDVKTRNRAPEFLSFPSQQPGVGQLWEYSISIRDDGDAPPTLTLNDAAIDAGMEIINNTTLRWIPMEQTFVPVELTATDLHGASARQSFSLTPYSQDNGHESRILFHGIPPREAYLGNLFRYNPDAYASGINEDTAIVYELIEGPPGMQITKATGILQWYPNKLGEFNIAIQAINPEGITGRQNFTIEVLPSHHKNSPPRFETLPLFPAVLDLPYRYPISVSDPDGDGLEIAIDPLSVENGFRIDEENALTWMPRKAGTQRITISAVDSWGSTSEQSFDLIVLDNAPPQIHNYPEETLLAVGTPYQHTVHGFDPNPIDSLLYTLDEPPPGVELDADTGLFEWTPNHAGRELVTFVVTDNRGLSTTQEVVFTIIDPMVNHPPQIIGAPRKKLPFGRTYHYPIEARDQDGESLVFSLITGPEGMSVEPNGLLSWTPRESQVTLTDPHQVIVRVTDARGSSDEVTWEFRVGHSLENEPPLISEPELRAAVAGRIYQHQFEAFDFDGDPISWQITPNPKNAQIDSRGLFVWTPTFEELGRNRWTLISQDPWGSQDEFDFEINVRGSNTPAQIQGNPPTLHRRNTLYQFQFTADDAEGDPIEFRFASETPTHGAQFDNDTGMFSWIPDTDGTYTFTVLAADTFNEGTGMRFAITVDEWGPNDPPVFTESLPRVADAGSIYEQVFSATDPEGLSVTYEIAQGPEGMTIDSVGKIHWPVPLGLVGQNVFVTLRAIDPAGLQGSYYLRIPVREPNNPPEILSSPDTEISWGGMYHYAIKTKDRDQDLVSMNFVDAPLGAKLDPETNRVSWDTTSAELGPYLFKVEVTDGRVATPLTHSWTVNVIADNTAPTVHVDGPKVPTNLGQSIVLSHLATDNVKITERSLLFDGVPIALDANGRAVIQLKRPGLIPLKATAIDSSGNIGTYEATLRVNDPNNAAPTIQLAIPYTGEQITRPTAIVGSISDAEEQLVRTAVFMQPSGVNTHPKLISEEMAAEGSFLENKIDQALITIDPTTLPNGPYELVFVAEDAAGNLTTQKTTVEITGLFKIGTYSSSYDDLTIPISGIPITVRRTFDSLHADSFGDFGYGWNLDINQIQLRFAAGAIGGAGQGRYTAYRDGTKVQVLMPEGVSIPFQFQPKVITRHPSFETTFEPAFVPTGGSLYQLIAPFKKLRKQQNEYYTVEGVPYNPADPEIGNYLILVTPEGLRYRVNLAEGKTETVTDRNGNQIKFTATSIKSNRGTSIQIERDHRNRISAIIDPRGNRITYAYDAHDRLISITDRLQNTLPREQQRPTRLTYHKDYPNHLHQTIAGDGTLLSSSAIDSEGRMNKVGRNSGFTIESTFDVTARSQSVTTTDLDIFAQHYDENGNLTRIVDSSNSALEFTYSASGKPTSMTRVIYNQESGEIAETFPYTMDLNANGQVLVRSAPNGNQTRYIYDRDTGLLSAEIDFLGNRTSYDYDDRGNQISITKPNQQETRYILDEFGNVVRASIMDLSPGSQGDCESEAFNVIRCFAETLAYEATYDDRGNQIARTNHLGVTTEKGYDANHQLIQSETRDQSNTSSRPLIAITQYDPNDQPIAVSSSILENSGETTSLRRTERQHNLLGQVTSELDLSGETITSTYNKLGLPSSTKSVSPTGITLISYQIYDSTGRLSIQTDPVATDRQPVSGKRYQYDRTGQIIQTESLIGLTLDIQQAGEHLEVSLIDEGHILPGAVATADAINHPGLIATKDGRSTQRVRDYLGRTIETRTTVRGSNGVPDIRIQRTAYDKFGRIETATDPYVESSNTVLTGVRNVYSPTGEIIRVDRVSGLRISIVLRPDGTWESRVDTAGTLIDNNLTQHDGGGRTTSIQQHDGTRVEFVYDGMGRTVLRREIPADPSDSSPQIRLTVHESNDQDGLISTITTDALSDNQQQYRDIQATRTITDRQGRTVRTELLSGSTVSFENLPQGRGRVTLIDRGEIIAFSATTYDSLGRILSERSFSGGVTDYLYDEAGNLITLTGPSYFDADLNQTVRPQSEYVYTGNLLLSKTEGIRVFADGSVDLAVASTTRFVYDTSGRLVRTDLPNGLSTSTQYDSQGRPVVEKDADGQETRYLFDSSGNLSSILLPLTEDQQLGSYHPRTDFAYDDWGNRISTTTGLVHFPDGTVDRRWVRESKDTYDATGRLVSTERPEGLVERRSYTEQGSIDLIERADGTVESYVWSEDTLNPGLLRTEYYDSLVDHNTGIAADFTIASTDLYGNVTTSFGAGEIEKKVNDRGQFTTITSPSGTLVYEYDRFGRIEVVASLASDDPDKRRTEVRYEYDTANRLARVTQTIHNGEALQNPITYQYTHDVHGHPARIIHPDGTIEVHRYDLLGRRTGVEYFAPDQTPETLADNRPLARFLTSFDSAGHRAYLHEKIWDGVTSSIVAQREIFLDHDASGRLIRYRLTGDTESMTIHYAYDPAHNRTTEKRDLQSDGVIDTEKVWTYDRADRIQSETTFIGTVPTTIASYEYLPGASSPHTITTRTHDEQSLISEVHYEYDLRGYLSAVDTVYGDAEVRRERTEWSRTPIGTPFQKREIAWENQNRSQDKTTDILIDDQSLTGYSQWFETRNAETDDDLISILAGHRVLAEIAEGQPRGLFVDSIGSVRLIREGAEETQAFVNYDPFGTVTPESALVSPSLHGYSGEIQDAVTGLIELRQRTYAPSLGRFLQPDRFAGLSQVPTSLHRYAYASNAPYTFRDPSGNVFVLIDGTWNHDRPEYLEEGEDFTNIVKLRDAHDALNEGAKAKYRRGVGNPVDNGIFRTKLGGGFGLGLTKIVEEAVAVSFHQIMDGEPIYVAGFSRGATASLQYAHEIQKYAPAARINFLAIYDPVGSVGFPGNGINIGFNLSLASNVQRATNLISWQEDRGFFPGTNLHTRRASQSVTFGVHSDVGGGYGTAPTEMIADSLAHFSDAFKRHGLNIDQVGSQCPLCTEANAHYPHSTRTYFTQGGQVPGGLRRPMVEHPMPGELALAFFAEEISTVRVGTDPEEARAIMASWTAEQVIGLIRTNIRLSPGFPKLGALHLAWNLGKLHASHIHYWVNRT